MKTYFLSWTQVIITRFFPILISEMLDTKATAMKIIKVVFILGLLQVCLCQKSDQIRDKV